MNTDELEKREEIIQLKEARLTKMAEIIHECSDNTDKVYEKYFKSTRKMQFGMMVIIVLWILMQLGHVVINWKFDYVSEIKDLEKRIETLEAQQ